MDGLKDISSVLADADPKLKAQLYEELGITVRYDPSTRIVVAQSRPEIACANVSVGGGIRINTVGLFDATPAWGSAHVGARFGGDPVREVGTTELWLPAA